jgi:hypothetical protein
MSHFTVLVVGDDVEAAMAPFDENKDVAEYVRRTKDQVISEGRAEIEKYRDGLYAEYLADPEGYAAKTFNPRHLTYLREEFPQKLTWTDEQVYADAIQWVERVDEDGNELSTSNPHGEWDWWVIGGRWDRALVTKSGEKVNETTAGELDLDATKPTFAVVHDGKWHEKGDMGWWAMVVDEKDQDVWDAEWRSLVSSLPLDARVTLVDAHV